MVVFFVLLCPDFSSVNETELNSLLAAGVCASCGLVLTQVIVPMGM